MWGADGRFGFRSPWVRRPALPPASQAPLFCSLGALRIPSLWPPSSLCSVFMPAPAGEWRAQGLLDPATPQGSRHPLNHVPSMKVLPLGHARWRAQPETIRKATNLPADQTLRPHLRTQPRPCAPLTPAMLSAPSAPGTTSSYLLLLLPFLSPSLPPPCLLPGGPSP